LTDREARGLRHEFCGFRQAYTLIRTSRDLRRFSHTLPLVLAVTACASGLIVSASRAQESAPRSQPPLQSSTELVKVDVSVLDRHGDFVGGLAQSDFQVSDNGAAQRIVYFAPIEAPAQVLVMIETSPAVYLIHNEHLAAAYSLFDGLAPGDEVAVVSYAEEPRTILGFTRDRFALLSALGGLQYTIGMGELNLYDSVSTVLDWLASAPGKKGLVLLSTGLDSSPPAHLDALTQRVQSSDVVIFPVALGGSLRPSPGKKSGEKNAPKAAGEDKAASWDAELAAFVKAHEVLLSLARITGGRAYFPESAKDFAKAYREIASALRHEYVLGIAPAHDDQFHPLTVEVLHHSGQPHAKKSEYRVLARRGYLARRP
jgi:VWFA-related protein